MSTQNRIADDQTIERIVFDVLRERWGPPLLDWFKERLLNKPRRELQKTDKIIGDVWRDSDDAGYFALEVEKRIGIVIPRDAWASVYTIQDVIDLFKRHRDHAA
jgi:acyl carrier protein